MNLDKDSIAENFFEVVFWIIFSVLWVVVSIIVMGIYQYLAGDNVFPLTESSIFLGTPIAIVIFVTIVAKILEKRSSPQMFQGAYKKMAKVLSYISIWIFLPILLNLFSIFTKFIGLTYVSKLLFDLRYRSLFLSIIIMILYFITRHFVRKRTPAR